MRSSRSSSGSNITPNLFISVCIILQQHEIAERLVLSGKTVRNHVSNILSKLQVADRAQAIRHGREAGLGHIPAD
jgi:FixJ family two-component response regulator